MKKGAIITYGQVSDAALMVQDELFTIGLWNNSCRLIIAEIVYCSFPQIKSINSTGFFLHGTSKFDRVLGYRAGHIYVPRMVLSQLFKQNRGSLRDVIRHEYGHAFAHYYPDLTILSPQFEKVFGGKYFDQEPSYMGPDAYITEYARTLPMEDFAETFMVYVRRKGKIPKGLVNRNIKRKWMFISKVIELIDK